MTLAEVAAALGAGAAEIRSVRTRLWILDERYAGEAADLKAALELIAAQLDRIAADARRAAEQLGDRESAISIPAEAGAPR